jgi:hypothetical protein
MSIRRTAYLLTTDMKSERTLFSEEVLQRVGFDVKMIQHIPNEDNVLSNKLSMLSIYKMIADGEDEFGYVFENDINILEEIRLPEIVKYEKITEMFFYLGLCAYRPKIFRHKNDLHIDGHRVLLVAGGIRGLHAIGLSKKGAKELIQFAEKSDERYMDMILEQFSMVYPANVVKLELMSYILGHHGVFFQDRKRFPSEIS